MLLAMDVKFDFIKREEERTPLTVKMDCLIRLTRVSRLQNVSNTTFGCKLQAGHTLIDIIQRRQLI
jgi:hypothetical protein